MAVEAVIDEELSLHCWEMHVSLKGIRLEGSSAHSLLHVITALIFTSQLASRILNSWQEEDQYYY